MRNDLGIDETTQISGWNSSFRSPGSQIALIPRGYLLQPRSRATLKEAGFVLVGARNFKDGPPLV